MRLSTDRSDAAPLWSNQEIVLYHGTTLSQARNIRTIGVDLDFARLRRDFGRGFYATTNIQQAKKFARDKAQSRKDVPGIVSLTLDREVLSRLDSLSFVLGNPEAEDYWSLVQSCRDNAIVGHGRATTAGGGYYDLVVGPVAKDWDRRTLHPGFDQLGFHTERAVTLLNAEPQRRMIVPWTP